MPIRKSSLDNSYPSGTTAERPASTAIGSLYFNTDLGVLQIYTSNGWFVYQNPASPLAPTAVVATNQGTSRAFNNGRASVAFTPTGSGGVPTSFTVTSSPGGYTGTGSTSPITVDGLQSNTSYTYTVTSTNLSGTSSASSASSAVTATTIPQAPSISAVSGNAKATLTITPGATGGSAITQYSIISSPATTTQTTSSTSYEFTGLTNGTAYTFTVTAINANGTSAASASSNSITPSAIATIKATGGQTFTTSDYAYHLFTGNGTFTPTSNISGAEVLVIAGGGGAARGPGGAGGLRGLTSQSFNNGTNYTITVGSGGTAYSGDYVNRGTNGNNSSIAGSGFSTISASGGGGGGAGHANANGNGSAGGSGGGAGVDDDTSFTGGAGNAGGYSPPEGYAGGNATIIAAFSDYGAGGGGGAGGPGGNNSSGNVPGAGGLGVSTYSTWGQVTNVGHNVGGTYWFASGGTARSTATSGGGGSSSSIPGIANTGGGSGATPALNSGQTGGSGVVIIRYP